MKTNHRSKQLRTALLAALLLSAATAWAGPPAQAFIARQFLLAILQGRYNQAYQLLAPEAQAALSRQRFRQAAAPVYQSGQQAGPRIELYRLGLRLGDSDGDTRWFYAFRFQRDSAATAPAQLDVTFRDTTATRVLEFRLVPGKKR